MRNLLLVVAALLSSAGSTSAQSWHLRADRPMTGNTIFPAGGPNGHAVGVRNGWLWRWSGTSWLPSIELPAGNAGIVGMAYDYARRVSVMVSYWPSGTYVTYELDAGGWTQVASSPTGGTLVYDPALAAVLQLGQTASVTQDHFWNGSSWVALGPNLRPLEVRNMIAPDFGRARLVGFASGPSAATYEWDGGTWTQIATPVGPPARDNAAMAFDPTTATVLMYGSGTLSDTWLWDGTTWTQVPATPVPAPSDSAVLSLDRTRASLVLLDRSSDSTTDHVWSPGTWSAISFAARRASMLSVANHPVTGDVVRHVASTTLSWDGFAWTQLATGGPSNRRAPMSFDLARNEFVVFGGWTMTLGPPPTLQPLGDTWTLNGNTWSQYQGPAPTARRNHALVAHPASGGLILFGGLDGSGSPLADTWLWNGQWTQLGGFPVTPPAGPALGGDSAANLDPFVLAGTELWQFDGQWTLVSNQLPGPSPDRWNLAMLPNGAPMLTSVENSALPSYELVNGAWSARAPVHDYLYDSVIDPARNVLVGLASGDMFVYTNTPAEVATTGSGCGAPAPSLWHSEWPRIGSPALRIHAGDVTGFAAFVVDFAAANVPLGGGCTAYVANPLLMGLALANATDVATQPFPIPLQTNLLGLEAHLQAVAPQSGAPFLGLAVSPALTMTIGH